MERNQRTYEVSPTLCAALLEEQILAAAKQ
jgi:hypothetical protein